MTEELGVSTDSIGDILGLRSPKLQKTHSSDDRMKKLHPEIWRASLKRVWHGHRVFHGRKTFHN